MTTAGQRANYTCRHQGNWNGLLAFPDAGEGESSLCFNQLIQRAKKPGQKSNFQRVNDFPSRPVLTFVQHLRLSHWTCSLPGRCAPTPVRSSAALAATKKNQDAFTADTEKTNAAELRQDAYKLASGLRRVSRRLGSRKALRGEGMRSSARIPQLEWAAEAHLTPPLWHHCHAHITVWSTGSGAANTLVLMWKICRSDCVRR